MANSNLISNLNSIYATKLEIKEVLNTESDDFTEYPDLIEAAIASGGATGTYNITENGTFDVATYASAYVAVPQQEVPVVPPGYSYVYGTKEILENGTVDISSYASAYVNVPAPEGWILPSGYAFVTTNGNFDIREFESVNVEVPASAVVSGTYNIIENGTFDVTSYASAYVSVQGGAAVLGYQTILNNGITYASTYGLDGFSYVDVQVPQSGGGHSGTSAVDAWTVDEAVSYISAFEDTNEHLYTELGFTPYVEGVIAAVRNTRSAQYPSARYTITRTGESPAADFSNAIICWNINPAIGQQSWTEGVDRQVKVGDHVIIAADKLQKYYDSNNDVYQMEFKNGAEIQGQSEVANTLNISQSGTYDVQSYVSAYVNVSGGSQYPEITIQSLPYTMQNFVLDANLGTTVYLYDGLLSTMDNGLSQLPYGTYVSGVLTPVFSDDYVNQVAGSQLYVEKTEPGTGTSYITVDSGITYPWQNTNVVINSAEFSSQDAGLSGGLTNKMWFITDPVSMVSYPISSYDYNTWRSYDGGNIIINYDADTTWGFPMPITACIVGVDNS